ncbi:MAG: esterase family protein [Pirellulales bacterium]|nr:esterase family protein [Pirellulales bacterium]
MNAAGTMLVFGWALLWATGLKAAEGGAPDLRVEERIELSPRLIEYKLSTSALAEPTSVRVLLPQNVEADRHYPVLYLLHGGVGDYRDWIRGGDVERLTLDLPLIVVMPDGGRIGWYTNWFNRGAGGQPLWETYHIDQLIPWIDTQFPTVATREGRAIAGLSMGGFGAMSYAARHPDLFVAAAAFSGYVDIGDPQCAARLQAVIAVQKIRPEDVFGRYSDETIRWRARNPVDLAENLRHLTVVLRTGNGRTGPGNPRVDILELGVHVTMESLHTRLDELNIENIWEDYGPAAHNFTHWKRSLEKTLPNFMETFARPPAPPAAITFVAAEPEFSCYGWQVKRSDAALAFVTLKNASRQGFELLGTGEAVVTTPSQMFAPDEEILVVFHDGSAPRAPKTMTADREGRLVVPVRLGAADDPAPTPRNVAVSFESTSPGSASLKAESAEGKP